MMYYIYNMRVIIIKQRDSNAAIIIFICWMFCLLIFVFPCSIRRHILHVMRNIHQTFAVNK
jgi:hypothetical protein